MSENMNMKKFKYYSIITLIMLFFGTILLAVGNNKKVILDQVVTTEQPRTESQTLTLKLKQSISNFSSWKKNAPVQVYNDVKKIWEDWTFLNRPNNIPNNIYSWIWSTPKDVVVLDKTVITTIYKPSGNMRTTSVFGAIGSLMLIAIIPIGGFGLYEFIKTRQRQNNKADNSKK